MKKSFSMIMFMLMIVSVLSVLHSNKAFACSCMDASVESRFQDSSVIFTGALVSKDTEGGNTFKVDKLWKGKLSEGYVFSGFFGMCGTEFELGSEYLVYTYNHEGNEKTGLCSGNKLISEASADIEALDRLMEPAWRGYIPLILVIGFTLALLLIVWGAKRRRNE
ncbi:hypothetical protein BK133_07500 [Paenibacillus sp. FSL H8-0548]|uniref:hypothetical protein n=1 Tax=Paenibacillus sp. FSL H8-0548 TaxID=1920422 RepID=UPI00096DFBB5|nr:hypothetical protein [Paenibacillus sp. FSL H8-0548]OMF37045.1 hypothetical protein BK133_07500 [Paenibacillus sp. FSL H8-0548]